MSSPSPASPDVRVERRLVVDIVLAYEGILLGLVIVVVSGILSGTTGGLGEFAAVVALPAVLMVVFMHLHAPPRRLFVLRATGALVGWGLGWVLIIPLFIALSYAVFSGLWWPLVFVVVAVVDGVVLAVCIAAVDRLGKRVRPRVSTERSLEPGQGS